MSLVCLYPKTPAELRGIWYGLRLSGYQVNCTWAVLEADETRKRLPQDFSKRAKTVRVYPPNYDSTAIGPESSNINEPKGETSEEIESTDGSCPSLGR